MDTKMNETENLCIYLVSRSFSPAPLNHCSCDLATTLKVPTSPAPAAAMVQGVLNILEPK